jgi:hypothetical protein
MLGCISKTTNLYSQNYSFFLNLIQVLIIQNLRICEICGFEVSCRYETMSCYLFYQDLFKVL